MSRTYRVAHRTTYRYGATMTDGYSVAVLAPRDTDRQRVVVTEVRLDPIPSETDVRHDVFGNRQHQFGLHEPHDSMQVVATSDVVVEPASRPDDATPWEEVVGIAEHARDDLAIEVGMFRSTSSLIDLAVLGDPLRELAAAHAAPGRPIVDVAASLCTAIFEGFEFDPHFSNVSTPLAEVLTERRGVCQDFAHLAVGALRSLGLAARYVSGYIETTPPPGRERLVGADASHAWCSVWTPAGGWVDFDPTNGHLPVDDHVTVGWGRDYDDVKPVRGVMIGPATSQQLDVAVDVTRLEGERVAR